MVAVAERTATARKEYVASRNAPARVRRAKARPRSRVNPIKFILSIAGLICVFGYVGVYANLTAVSYNRSKLMSDYRLEKIKNQRLRVELIRRSSPIYVVAGAERAGMAPAVTYDYLGKTQTVASAGR